ncbi:MAG: hypothetical protein IPP33_13290 [Flavobacteriales bacterium]|nr:hypothetical protein [Flavobacteriales bacterium]
MKAFVSRNPVTTFIALTLGFQVGVVVMAYNLMDGGSLADHPLAHNVFRIRPFGPLFFATGITFWLEGWSGLKHLFASLLHWRVPAKWYALAFSWKFILGYTGIGVSVILGLRSWPASVDSSFIWSLLRNMPFIIGIALVEETSWMKFGVTRMQGKYPAWRSCLTVGIGWGLWYVPMIFLREGVPSGVAWQAALLSMISLTFFLGWAYNETRSGTVLLIMQILSNCTFFVVPILPSGPDMDQTFAVAYALTLFTLACIIVWRAGPKEMSGSGMRAMWGEKSHSIVDQPLVGRL